MIRTFVKIGNCLVPADPDTVAAVSAMKQGAILTADFKLKNNYEFHKKLFALANYAYEMWSPTEIDTKWGVPEKTFDGFRDSLTVQAGFYKVVYNLDNTFRPVPESWSFSNWDHARREQFYQAALTVIIERIFPGFSANEVEETAAKHWNQLMSFT